MIQSYKQNPDVEEHYDSIIIGSGMGALATASILSKEGQSVLILERHYTAGGFTHVFKRRGYEWDVGIHYIGEVQKKESLIRKVFDYVTDGNLHWADMGEVYDRIFIGDKIFDLVKGVKNFKEKMLGYFPEEEKAINKYVDLVFAARKASKNFYINKTLPNFLSNISAFLMRRPFYKFSDRTTYEVISSLTNNQELIKVLSAQYGDYGLPPKQSSFTMHASVVCHYFDGGSFPIGGSSQIVKTIAPVIAKAGGTILINAEVKEINVDENNATGVTMVDGQIFKANNIISGAGIMTTYDSLIPKPILKKYMFKEQLQKVERSVAHASLYIGLEDSPENLQLPKTNFWIYPEDCDHDTSVERYLKDINQPFPLVYISFPSAKDPDFINRYPGKSTIDIITLLPYDTFAPWSNTKWMKRGADYKDLKEKISKRLLLELYKKLPHLEGKVAYYELSTPLTTKHFINYEKGEIYGLSHNPSRFRQKFLKPKTPINNFYLTGQDIVTAGIGGALLSAVLTGTVILKKNVFKKILA